MRKHIYIKNMHKITAHIFRKCIITVRPFILHLPFTLDCSCVDLKSRADTDWILMEGENASNVDVSCLRKLRQYFCPICLTQRRHSSDSQEGKKEQICYQKHSCSPQYLLPKDKTPQLWAFYRVFLLTITKP